MAQYETNSAIDDSGSDSQWRAVLAELIARPRPALGTTTPSGAVLLGTGLSADVWGIQDYAVKLFRCRTGFSVPKGMVRETETYKRLSPCSESGLPRLFAYGDLNEQPEDPNACGWAKYSRVPGLPMGYAALKSLTDTERTRWVHDVVTETINIETALNEVEPLPGWKDDYAEVRIDRLKQWAEKPGKITNDDLVLAYKLESLIASETITRKYIHGDLNPPNVITDLKRLNQDASIVKFVDPLITFDAPEANWRHFTLIPDLANALADDYAKRTNTTVNRRLMYAIGALTNLYIAIDEPQDSVIRIRRKALSICLRYISLS